MTNPPTTTDAGTTLHLWGAKGGVGTTTVAALYALALARAGHPTRLRTADGDVGDLAAVLGLPDADGPLDVNAATAAPSSLGSVVTVVDGGTDAAPATAVTRRLVVVRPCYLALRRALRAGLAGTDGAVLVAEPQRSLAAADVEDVLGLAVVATVAVTAEMARLLDAGLLAARTPRLAQLDRDAVRMAG
ncbi:MAG TPA: hypothetical protein VFJ85_12830 [Acidimicrobiales bacterium]|nr:hypothetical protein [Acidimicrobiales bacterium]